MRCNLFVCIKIPCSVPTFPNYYEREPDCFSYHSFSPYLEMTKRSREELRKSLKTACVEGNQLFRDVGPERTGVHVSPQLGRQWGGMMPRILSRNLRYKRCYGIEADIPFQFLISTPVAKQSQSKRNHVPLYLQLAVWPHRSRRH